MSYGGYGQTQGYGGGHGYGGGSYGGPPGYGGGGPGPGGFAPAPSGPPPGADPQLWSWFTAVDTDRSGHITVHELQKALINGDWSPFDLDTVKLLMTIFDTDRSGTIGFNEFSGLWKYIKDWQNVFRHFDRDRSGSIDGQELSNALQQFGYNLSPPPSWAIWQQFGYNLSPPLLRLLESKYDFHQGTGPRGGPGMPPSAGGITFDRFVRACVVVKQISESFQRLDTNRSGWVQMNYEQFMHTVLSLP